MFNKPVVKGFISFLTKMKLSNFIVLFTLLAIIFSETLIALQSYWLHGEFVNRDFLIIGFFTPLVVAAVFFTIFSLMIHHLRNLEKQKDTLVEALNEKAELLQNVINENLDPVVAKDWEGKFVLVNEACAALYGTTPDEMIGKDDGDYIEDKAQAEFFRNNVQEIMREGVTKIVYEDSYDVKSGEKRHYKSTKTPYKNSKGQNQILVVAHDITQDKIREEELTFTNYTLSKVSDANYLVDENANIVRVNEAASKMLGYTKEELESMTVFDIHPASTQKKWKNRFQEIEKLDSMLMEAQHRRKDGTYIPVEININHVKYKGVNYHLSFVRDITQKKEQQQKLEHMAHYDALTGLPNRVLLSDRIEKAMTQAVRRKNLIAIAYIDLDGFKEVNDTYGHKMGDILLKRLAQTMQKLLRESDTISRLGGDEFVAVLTDIKEKKFVDIFLKRLLVALSRPIEIDGINLAVSASIGVTFYPQEESISSEQLIRQADSAMYEAKVLGKNRFVIFNDSKEINLIKNTQEYERVEEALNNGEFELYYQAKVNMRSGDILGAEALIRWNHPQKGLLYPIEFLPLVEGKSLSVEIDKWVIQEALKQLKEWKKESLEYSISVNIGAQILQELDFVSFLQEQLDEYEEVDNELLILELLETNALENLEHIRIVIEKCKAFGVNFSLDDFGTGYSTLTYLKHLPVTQIKIDRTFVQDILDDPDDLIIVDGIFSFAQAFNREIIAEGVESVEHGEMLLQLGCELAQGYAISRPIDINAFILFTKSWKLPEVWKKTATINRSDTSILFASVEHRSLIKTIKSYLEDDPKELDIRTLDDCRFGKWIHSKMGTTYENSESYQRVVKFHSEIHNQVDMIILTRHNSSTQEKEFALARLNELSKKLLNELNHLYEK